MVAIYDDVRPASREWSVQQTRDLIIARSLRRGLFAVTLLTGLALLALPVVYPKAVLFSPLWIYGALIGLFSLAGFAADYFSRERAAMVLAYLLFADLGLATGTFVLSRLHIGTDLVPNMTTPVYAKRGFEFHPLLQLAVAPDYAANGFEHTPQGTRAVADAPRVTTDLVDVALVGGSSTYDIDLPQGKTWPDMLQQHLPEFRIWNFGVPSYTTAGHLVQTTWYVPRVNAKCVVYYIGWNDVRNTHVPALDPAYADYHQIDLANHGFDLNDRGVTASARFAALAARKFGPYPSTPAHYANLSTVDGPDPELERIYKRNIETLIGINRERGVKTAFIGQLLNNKLLAAQGSGQRAFGAPAVEDRYIPAAMERLNAVLEETAKASSIPVMLPSQDWLAPQDYTDFGHFTATGADKFSGRVAKFINDSCAPDQRAVSAVEQAR
jgi:lysophospholipase L1-like esterase